VAEKTTEDVLVPNGLNHMQPSLQLPIIYTDYNATYITQLLVQLKLNF